MSEITETTNFNNTQFSETSTEWSDFNREISRIVQAWDDYFFKVTGVRIDSN